MGVYAHIGYHTWQQMCMLACKRQSESEKVFISEVLATTSGGENMAYPVGIFYFIIFCCFSYTVSICAYTAYDDVILYRHTALGLLQGIG